MLENISRLRRDLKETKFQTVRSSIITENQRVKKKQKLKQNKTQSYTEIVHNLIQQ